MAGLGHLQIQGCSASALLTRGQDQTPWRESCPVHCRMVSSLPGLTHQMPAALPPQCDNQTCLGTWPLSLGIGGTMAPVEKHWANPTPSFYRGGHCSLESAAAGLGEVQERRDSRERLFPPTVPPPPPPKTQRQRHRADCRVPSILGRALARLLALTYLFSECSLNTCLVPSLALGTWDTALSKSSDIPDHMAIHLQWREIDNKERCLRMALCAVKEFKIRILKERQMERGHYVSGS